MLEALLRGPDELLLLDEPDNYLDVAGKQWLEHRLQASTNTILLVSHDRQLLANVADRIVTVEDRDVWVYGGGFATYAQARHDRSDRLDERRRRWNDEHRKLTTLVHTLRQTAARNDSVASAYRAARTRLARFEQAGPPQRPPKEQNIRVRLRGGRTGKRALITPAAVFDGLGLGSMYSVLAPEINPVNFLINSSLCACYSRLASSDVGVPDLVARSRCV